LVAEYKIRDGLKTAAVVLVQTNTATTMATFTVATTATTYAATAATTATTTARAAATATAGTRGTEASQHWQGRFIRVLRTQLVARQTIAGFVYA